MRRTSAFAGQRRWLAADWRAHREDLDTRIRVWAVNGQGIGQYEGGPAVAHERGQKRCNHSGAAADCASPAQSWGSICQSAD